LPPPTTGAWSAGRSWSTTRAATCTSSWATTPSCLPARPSTSPRWSSHERAPERSEERSCNVAAAQRLKSDAEGGGLSLIERAFRERIVLVGVTIPPTTMDETDAHLDELALLVDTAGADVAERV